MMETKLSNAHPPSPFLSPSQRGHTFGVTHICLSLLLLLMLFMLLLFLLLLLWL